MTLNLCLVKRLPTVLRHKKQKNPIQFFVRGDFVRKVFSIWLFLLCAVLFTSCQKDMTDQLQKQLQLQNTRILLKTARFSDCCTVVCRDGDYILSDFSDPAFKELTVRIGEGRVQHTLADLSLSPVTEGVEEFLLFYRLLSFLQMQKYPLRDAEQNDVYCFTFPFEGESVTVTATKTEKLLGIICGSLSIEIQKGNG